MLKNCESISKNKRNLNFIFMENRYLNDDDLKFLERIDPFPEVVEKLNDIFANFEINLGRDPFLEFKDISADDPESASESEWNMPKLIIGALEPSSSDGNIVFQVSINLWNCDQTRHGKSALVCWLTSRFKRYFADYNYANYYAVLEMDKATAARFMTYYLKVFGYKGSSDFKIGMYMCYNTGSKSKLYLPDDVAVPETFRRAVSKLKELQAIYDDGIFIRLSGLRDRETNESVSIHAYIIIEDVVFVILDYSAYFTDRNEIERRRLYRNFDCLDAWAEGYEYTVGFFEGDSEESLRFITDYFLFLNPDISNDEIVASLDFCYCRYDKAEEEDVKVDEDISDWLYSFYPDGSEDAPEILSRLLDELENRRKCYDEKYEEENSTQVHGLSPDGENLDYKAFRETEPSDAVQYIYNDLDCYKVGRQGGRKACFYDEDKRLVMEISRQDLGKFYFSHYNVKTVCTFYLSPEQKEEFYKLYSAPRLETYEYEAKEDSEPPVTICLPDDVGLVSKYVAYCLTSVGYDPKRLSCELDFIKCDNPG